MTRVEQTMRSRESADNPLGIRFQFVLAGILTLSRGVLGAAETSSPTNSVSFSKHIAPVLAQKCVSCHGPEKARGGYQLHSYAAMTRPGDSKEPPLTPGQPEKSRLFQLITARDADDRMPQKDDPLPVAQVGLFRRWIGEGAKFDGADPKQTLASLTAGGSQPDPPDVYSRPVPVLALAFSGDGAEIAAGGYHEITIWSVADGRLLRRIKNVAQQVTSLEFSPDGSLLAAAAGTPGRYGEVKLFAPESARLMKTLAVSGDTMLAVAFSPDGRRLASSGSDNAIRIFDLATGRQECLIEQHADWIFGLAFSPDGSSLASASRDKTARLFDAKTGALDQTYTGHSGPVFAVAFGGDGRRVFSSSRDREIHVWDVAEAKKLGAVTGYEGDVLKVLVSSNQIFSAATDRLIRHHAFDGKNATLVRQFAGHRDVVYSLARHARTDRLASGSFDGEVRIWDANDGSLVTAFIAAPNFLRSDPTRASAEPVSAPASR